MKFFKGFGLVSVNHCMLAHIAVRKGGTEISNREVCTSLTVHLNRIHRSECDVTTCTVYSCLKLTLNGLAELVRHVPHLTQWIRLVVVVFLQNTFTQTHTMSIVYMYKVNVCCL